MQVLFSFFLIFFGRKNGRQNTDSKVHIKTIYFLFPLLRSSLEQQAIEHAAVEQNGHAHIKPQHGHGDAGKAAVKHGIGTEVLHIDGEQR